MLKNLRSETIIVSSPMSFNGSSLRLWKITQTDHSGLRWLVLIPLALVLICIAWFVIVFWYMIFGILLVPFRLIRRSGRKNKRDKLRHSEILEAIEKNNR
jgi:hypothetical protein